MNQPTLPLSLIDKGLNPRKYFDPKEHQELVVSAKAHGILQPILLRQIGDRYRIVAGERRYRAALEAHGEVYEIPVVVKVMSDEEEELYSLVENVARANMSPTEEAAAASKILGQVGGDRDETARMCGMSRATLDKRLALMNCSESVQNALNERVIMLGHAELLAALPKEKQDIFLPIIIAEKKQVSELKLSIEKAALNLGSAIFDKAECAACPHNSSLQTAMFAESITDGNCTNSTCFNGKTEAALGAVVEGLKDEYPVIRLIRVGDNSTLVKLEADGQNGVGEEQAQACRGCADFGAAVSALPQAMGTVYKNRCFNPVCNANKIAARIKSETKEPEKPKATTGTPTTKQDSQPKASAPTAKVNEGERIKAYRVKVWRQAMKKEIAGSPELSLKYLIAISLNGNANSINATSLSKAFKSIAGKDSAKLNLKANAELVAGIDDAALSKMTTLLAASAMDDIDVSHLQGLAKHHSLDLKNHWKLDKEFLDLMTKSEIEFVAKEVGLDKAIGDDFKKCLTDKKDDLIAKLLAVKDFNYSAVIPKSIRYQ